MGAGKGCLLEIMETQGPKWIMMMWLCELRYCLYMSQDEAMHEDGMIGEKLKEKWMQERSLLLLLS
jgi:hypothetical protein